MPPMNKPSEQLAVHLMDVERVEPLLRHRLLHGRLDLTKAVKVGTEPVVRFTCSLLDAALACDVMQSEFRREGDAPARLYLLPPVGSWRRLPAAVTLTIAEGDDRPSLNPDVFPSAVIEVPHVPLPPKAIVW